MSRPLIFISYHFSPDNEVGARRPTAFARRVTEEGLDAVVISAFGGIANDEMAGCPAASMVPVHVADPRKWVLKALVRLRNRLTGLLRQRTAKRGAGGYRQRGVTTDPAVSEFKSVLAMTVINVATVIDTCKLWSWRAAREAVKFARGTGACGIVASGPPMTNLLAATWASWRCRIPLIADLRDPWGVGVLGAPRRSKLDSWIAPRLERLVVRRAKLITVTTDALAKAMIDGYPDAAGKVHVVRNGFDGELLPPLRATANRLAILFAGEIYANRDPFGFLDALERLLSLPDSDPSRVTVTFVGRCEAFRGQSLKEWLRGRKSEAVVRILPPVHVSELAEAIEGSTVLLNLASNAPHSVPAKSYDHMASGREVLILCEAESATGRLFRNIDGVNCVDPSDAGALDAALADIYRRHVIQGIATVPLEGRAQEFSRRRQGERFMGLVRETIALPG